MYLGRVFLQRDHVCRASPRARWSIQTSPAHLELWAGRYTGSRGHKKRPTPMEKSVDEFGRIMDS